MAEMPIASVAKSFWQKPEGKTGMLFAAGGIVGVLLVMMKWGAALVAAAANTLVLGAYVIAACAIGYVLMDPRFRATVSYMYKGLMRFLTGIFIEINPINILKSYVDDLKENHERMNDQIGKLRGTVASLRRTIEQNESEARSSMELASEAKKRGLNAQMVLKTRKAGRLEQSNRTYIDLLKKVEMIYRVLSKMYENCGILIEDTDDQIKQKEMEWKTIRQAHSAMQSALNIIRGDKDKRAIYEQALDIMSTDLGNKIGEMERFMDLSQDFMDGIDLQNGVFEEKGLELLEKWEHDADSWLLGPDKATLVTDQSTTAYALPDKSGEALKIPLQGMRVNQYAQLFAGNDQVRNLKEAQ